MLARAGVEQADATPAPEIGEHGDAVLREGGIAPGKIAELRAQRAIDDRVSVGVESSAVAARHFIFHQPMARWVGRCLHEA